MRQEQELTRRQVIAAGLGGTAVLAGLPILTEASSEGESHREGRTAAGQERMPVAYIPHGGGPWPFVDLGFPEREQVDGLAGYLRSLRALPKTTPKALLVISAHWEEAIPTVMTAERPPMYYDYYGFPLESYRITWPAPGDPKLAARVQQLLEAAGFKTATDAMRGYDHGTFVPLKVTWPEANIPTIQLSLKRGLDPVEHIAMGRALVPLRDEGVFIVGSGMSYHNMRGFMDPQARGVAEAFDAWLQDAATREPAERDRRLTHWTSAPAARLVHPREEHLLPLMVVAGAAGIDTGILAYSGMYSQPISAYHFG